ncbi:MAG: PD-(D/E)XK nuclease family protein, partial [Lachnospiraceae bacterium]|nr:PD-(D/E)XK nuclease family protein [Lachnospiraceae bacterium]
KGLEFPIVFVAGLSRGMNRRDESAAVLADDRFGLGLTWFDLKTRVKRSTLRRYAIAEKIREESVGEEFRVLYVAMTRAKEKLILTARVKQEAADQLLAAQDLPEEVEPTPVSWLHRVNTSSYAKILCEALSDHPAPIDIRIMRSGSSPAGETAPEKEQKTADGEMTKLVNSNNIDRYLLDQILAKFDHAYVHPELRDLYVKTTVTEMKERMAEREAEQDGVRQLYRSTEEEETVPVFLAGRKTETGAARGTLYHRVMEILDAEILALDNISNQDEINKNRDIVYKWTIKQENKGRIRAGASEAVRPEDVLVFLCSSLGQRYIRAWQSGKLFREKQFMMGVEANRLDPGIPSDEPVLLQGVIDAGFEEEDGIVLLDYKTDRVHGDAAELAEKYRIQLSLYAMAIERCTGSLVKEAWIWSFDKGEAVAVSLEKTEETGRS